MSSFYKEFPCNFFFTWKSFVKIFPNLKLEIEFHSHKKVVSPKLENCAHLNIVNFMCAKFQQNQRTFFFYMEILCKFFPTFKLGIGFFSDFAKKTSNVPKYSKFICLELHLSQFSAKLKELF